MKISIDDLRTKVIWTLGNNMSPDEAAIVAEYFLRAEMSGYVTQGLIKMMWTEPIQHIVAEWPIKVEMETEISQLINAHKYPAPLVASIWTDIAIQKAKKSWFAIVGIRNTFSSNGVQWYYVEKIAQQDLIWIMCSRSPAAVHWFWSIEPLFWTNPIWFWFPTTTSPLVFDMATAAMTWYWLVLAKAKWERIDVDMARNALWQETTDPEQAMQWSLHPFDRSYKGAGLSMMIEILTWPLLWWAWIDNQTFQEEWWSVIIAINPSILIDVDLFKYNCTDLIHKIKNSKSNTDIRLPWERGRKEYEKCLSLWFIDVDESILKELWYI